jgi:Transposase and inactivated derivatives
MPRKARIKAEDAIYHIMSRSISEVDLFQCNEDKDYYLRLLKRYKEKYHCSIYAFCLMDNHVHMFLNPNGYDISRFMHCLNSAYVTYFNKHHKRHGHLFQGRFASRIVNDDIYALALKAYIHNNAADLPGYSGREETYRYSSYGVYTGYRKDIYGIVDTGFLLELFNKDIGKARLKCIEFTSSMRGSDIMADVEENIVREYLDNEYRDDRKILVRSEKPGSLIERIAGILGKRVAEDLRAKYIRETSGSRAFVTYVLRVLCGYTYRMICEYIGNMSVSGISRLFKEGFNLVSSIPTYRNAFKLLVQ